MSSADIRVAKMQDKQKIYPALVFFLFGCLDLLLPCFVLSSFAERRKGQINIPMTNRYNMAKIFLTRKTGAFSFLFFCLFIPLCLSESPCSLSFFPSAFVLFLFFSFLPQFKLLSLSSSFSSSLSHFILKNSVTFTDTKVPYKVYLSIFYL